MSIKLRALMGVSSLAALALAGAAHAGDIWGGGSTLIAPYHWQMAYCYGTNLPNPGDGAEFKTPPGTAFSLTPAPNCSTRTPTGFATSNTVHYALTGSGLGAAGVYSHDRSRYGVTAWTGDVQYGLSESALGSTEVGYYDNGTPGAGGPTPTVFQGITLKTPASGANQYDVPKPKYGPLVQFPVAVAPVALAYDPIYKKVKNADGTVSEYRFNVKFPRTGGGLHLDATTYCKIVNGQITDWNDPAITALNNNFSLQDTTDTGTFSVPIELVGRSESSGTTQVTTRHFAAACGSLTGNAFIVTAGESTLPVAVRGNPVGGAPVLGKFTLATGSGGVAGYVSFSDVPTTTGQVITRGRLGYVGADYALPASANNGLPYTLFTADLKNAAGAYRPPASTNATSAFSGQRAPESNSSGNYDATQTDWGSRSNAYDWVRLTSNSSTASLANPTPALAYPIVGTVNFLGYTCYNSSAKVDTIRTASVGAAPGYINYWFANPAVLTNAGLAPLPGTWQTAITETFLTPTTATSALNLYFDTAHAGGTTGNSACSVSTIVGA
ncbi:substrate-binding domain-containing protein [Caulobacter soli]|uniref:substrate-binding domain-containing protein n=1 Tax=Caulobacter soli TaxID=2708539 RepID=UPI0013ECEA33|nr:substrate-binding domain-containing protein [Caulobacter soli]